MMSINHLVLYVLVTAICSVIVCRDLKRKGNDIFDDLMFMVVGLCVYLFVIPGVMWAAYILINDTIELSQRFVKNRK